MRDLKTYLSMAPIQSTLWCRVIDRINRLFPEALIFPFFSF